MTKQNSKAGSLYVLSLGGSLVAPNSIDHVFLKKFRSAIQAEIKKGNRFILVCGGGNAARVYQSSLAKIFKTSTDDLDWMGIAATHLNARLMQLTFGPLAHHEIISDPNVHVKFKEKILIAGGWKPGRSSDDCAVRLAKIYGSQTVINLSNIDYVYDRDPRKFKNAKPVTQMSWPQYRSIIGKVWHPGGNFPFDPVASKSAQTAKQQVIIANGRDLKNLHSILAGKQNYKGTVIG